jgi:hypothetical protein
MRTILMTMIALVAFANSAMAQVEDPSAETIEIERSRSVTTLEAELNAQTVRCLVGDYGASSLKISIPEMRSITVFPHTTRGEVQPCINAGFCKSPIAPVNGLDPSMIIDNNKPTENVELTVVLKEVLSLDHKLKTCHRELLETVNTTVRGLKFAHADGAFLGSLEYDICVQMKELAKK